jgi:hypothetical protein
MDKPLPVGERVECPHCGARFALGKPVVDAPSSPAPWAGRISQPAADPWREEEEARRARKRRRRRRDREGLPGGLLLGLALAGMFLLIVGAALGLYLLVQGDKTDPAPRAAPGADPTDPLRLAAGPAALRQKLIGVWVTAPLRGGAASLEFRADGTLVVRDRGRQWDGTWQVVGGLGNTVRVRRTGPRGMYEDNFTFQDDNRFIISGGGAIYHRRR